MDAKSLTNVYVSLNISDLLFLISTVIPFLECIHRTALERLIDYSDTSYTMEIAQRKHQMGGYQVTYSWPLR